MDMTILEKRLAEVGEVAMLCGRKCEGVKKVETQCTPAAQSLISGTGNAIGCVVVSLTPLKAKPTKGSSQEGPPESSHRAQTPAYFSKLTDLCAELGLKDTFIWTPLCKCQRIKGQKLPPQTMEACARNLLARELEPVERAVPIVALGNRVFDTIRRCFPDRFVLNVPSPDTSRGDFQKTIGNRRLLDLAKRQIATNKPGALCLCPPCARKYFAGEAVR
jgi:hypothetical protein